MKVLDDVECILRLHISFCYKIFVSNAFDLIDVLQYH